MSIFGNLDAQGVLDREKKQMKDTTNSKFKSYKKTHEDRAKAILRSESSGKNDEEFDPYDKNSGKKISKSKVNSMVNSGYQTTLLEKILQGQNNPELLSSDLAFKQKTLDTLVEIRDIISEMNKGRYSEPEKAKVAEVKDREVSDLAKNIASMNISGLMGNMKTSAARRTGTSGAIDALSTVKEIVMATASSGMLGTMIKDAMQDTILSMFGGKNKAMIKSFKEDPLQAIQDGVNMLGLSKNNFLSKMFEPFMTGLKMQPSVVKNGKDPNGQALFDIRTHTTINNVIPDLLSRLVAQAEGTERTKFNHEEEKWMTVSQLLDQHSGKDSASKYTGDLINTIRDMVATGANNNKTSRAYGNIKKNDTGAMLKNSDNRIMFNDDQSFITLMKDFSLSQGSIVELMSGDPLKIVKKFGLAKHMTESKAAEIVRVIQDGLSNGDQQEIFEVDNSYRNRKARVNNVSEHSPYTADISKEENEIFKNLKTGSMTTKEAEAIYKNRGNSGRNNPPNPPNNGGTGGGGTRTPLNPRPVTEDLSAEQRRFNAEKNAKYVNSAKSKYGTVSQQTMEFNQSSRGYEATPEELKRINYSELHGKGMVSDKEYKSLIDGTSDAEVDAKVKRENKRLIAAYALYAQFADAGVTAYDMAKLTGEPVGRWISAGYIRTVDDVLSAINPDGSTNYRILESRNAKFTKTYMDDLVVTNNLNKEGKIKFDISDPVKSVDNVLNDLFKDPALIKKLGVGSGTAAGLAIGKLINNKTFIKSPKLGWLLGSIGAGVMSMERTQNYLTQTLGPASLTEGNEYSNREIFIAKMMNKWLPAVGLGGKTAQLTYNFLSKMGPLGKILGPVGALAMGGAVATFTPGLIKVAKKSLFADDGKGNKGVLKKLGRVLRKIPGVSEIYGGSNDTRTDDQVLTETVLHLMNKNEGKIKELEAKTNLTPEEEEKLKSLKAYQKELTATHERARSIATSESDETRQTEMDRLRTHISGDSQLDQRFQSELAKRDRRNVLGDASDAHLDIKSKDELAKSYASRAIRKYEGVDTSRLSQAEQSEYDILNRVNNGESITDIFKANLNTYLDSEGTSISNIAEALYEGNALVSKLGYSTLKGDGWKDSKGELHKPLMGLNSEAEYNEWLANLPEENRNFVNVYRQRRKSLYDLKDNLRGIAGVSVDSTTPGLGPRERELAIENLVKNGMLGSSTIFKYLGNKYNAKKKDIKNKILSTFDIGGVDPYLMQNEDLYADKIDSLSGGGRGTDVMALTKMKDLRKYKFKNGSRLSEAGCSIVAINNALNYLGLGGVSMEYLIEVANKYLSTDGGVTSDFMQNIAERMNLTFNTYNSVDNSFTNEMLAKFKPTSTKAVILLLRNRTGEGSHYVNLRTISQTKAMIDDPETNGVTDISTSSLVAFLLEVIVIEKGKPSALKESTTQVNENIRPSAMAKKMASNFFSTGKTSPLTSKPKEYAENGLSVAKPQNTSTNGVKDDGIINVRLVEDLTLPLKMTDAETALTLSRKLRDGTSNAIALKATKKIEGIRKQGAIGKEYAEAQKVQEDIARTADAVSGSSTGKGGAGSQQTITDGFSKKSERAAGIGALGASMLSLIPAFKTLQNTVKSFKRVFTSKDTELYDEEGNRQEAHSGNKAGHFARTRQLYTSASSMFTGAGKLIKNSYSKGKNFMGGVNAFRKNPIKTMKNVGSEVAEKATMNMDKVTKMVEKMGPPLANLPKHLRSFFAKVLRKIPFVGSKVSGVMFGPKNKSLWSKIDDFVKTFVNKFIKSFPKHIKKHFSKALPFIGLVMTIGGAAWSFYDGFTKADLWCNKPMEELTILTRTFVGMANALWNELPNLLASVLAVIPGVGWLISGITAVAGIVLQDMYGNFEKFLEMLGIRDLTNEDEKESKEGKDEHEKKIKDEQDKSGKKDKKPKPPVPGGGSEDKLTTKTTTGMSVTLSEGRNIKAEMDATKSKKANKDGNYKFTGNKTKNKNANDMYKVLKESAESHGVNSSLAMSQWALESNWGTSGTASTELAEKNNALFGIKKGSKWKGKTVMLPTTEVVTPGDYEKYWKKKGFIITGKKGNKLVISGKDEFRAYDTKKEAADDYMKLMSNNFKNGLDGYATDPNYAVKVKELMEGNFNVEGAYAKGNGEATLPADKSQFDIEGDIATKAPGQYASPTNNPYVTSAFGMRFSQRAGREVPHQGIDLRGKTGDPAKSIKDGKVIFTGTIRGGGNTVKIQHSDGTISEYMHLSKIDVSNGQSVKAGEVIGKIGATGGNYLPHLHLGIKKGKNYIDPLIALGIDPKKIKKTNSPENLSWLSRNSSYVSGYSDDINKMAETKVDSQTRLAMNNKPTGDGKGGPNEYANNRKDAYRASNDISSSASQNHSTEIYIKTLEAQNAKIAKSLETVTLLLGKLVDISTDNKNNTMNEIMMLSK